MRRWDGGVLFAHVAFRRQCTSHGGDALAVLWLFNMVRGWHFLVIVSSQYESDAESFMDRLNGLFQKDEMKQEMIFLSNDCHQVNVLKHASRR